MTTLFKDLVAGLDDVKAFLAAERIAPDLPAPHFHKFHISSAISTRNISQNPLRAAPAGVRSKSTEEQSSRRRGPKGAVTAGSGNGDRGRSGN